MTEIYVDPIIKRYQDLITTANGDTFKGIYQGDPVRIPASLLPALIISKTDTAVEPFNNMEDRHQIRMVITVVTDIRSDWNDNNQITPGNATLYDLIEGRDPDTLLLKEQSILHILRSNQNVDAALGLTTDLETITTANYGLTFEKRTPEGYAVESQITFTAHFIQLRNP